MSSWVSSEAASDSSCSQLTEPLKHSTHSLTEGQKCFSVGEGQKKVDIVVAYCPPKATKHNHLYVISMILKFQWVGWRDSWWKGLERLLRVLINDKNWTDTAHEDLEICLI